MVTFCCLSALLRPISLSGEPMTKEPAGMRTRSPSSCRWLGTQTLSAVGMVAAVPLWRWPNEQADEAHWLSAVQASPISLPLVTTSS